MRDELLERLESTVIDVEYLFASQIIQKSSNKIILDAYNANPSSMMLTIKYFEELSEKNKILILGDMFELGNISKACLHLVVIVLICSV